MFSFAFALTALVYAAEVTAAPASITPPTDVTAPADVTAPSAVTTAEAPAAATDAAQPDEGPVGEFGDLGDTEDLFSLSLQEEKNVAVDAVSKYGQFSRRSPANVVVITREDLRRYKYRSVPEALESVAGFFVYNDTLYDFVNVRGLGLPGDFNTRVLLLLNGHTMNVSAGSGGANLHDFNLDLQSVERIEVIKGPGSVVYGNHAFFAVINVITTAPETADADYVAALGGAPGAVRELSLSNGGRAGDFWWRATGRAYQDNGVRQYFEEYDPANPDAEDFAANAGFTNKDRDTAGGFYGRLGWKDLTLSVFGASRTKQEPTAQFYTEYNSRENYAQDQRFFTELAYEKDIAAARLTARLYADYGNWQDNLDYPEGIYRDLIDDRKAGGEVRAVWTLDHHQILLGAEGNRHVVEMPSDYLAGFRAANALNERIWFTTGNLYGQEDWRVTNWMSVIAGLQGSAHTIYKPAFSPRAGVLFFPTETQTLKLLYTTGIRYPTSFERFFEDFNAFIPNPDLAPERIQTGEVVYEFYPLDDLHVQTAAFVNNYRDVITAIDVPVSDDPEDTRNIFVNQGGVHSRGVELNVDLRLPRDWMVQVGGTYQEVIDNETSLTPDASPTWLGNFLASGPVVPALLTLATDLHYVGSRRLMDDSVTANPYWLLNATLATKRFWDTVEFSVRGRNLFDHAYHELVSADHDPITRVQERPMTGYARVDVFY